MHLAVWEEWAQKKVEHDWLFSGERLIKSFRSRFKYLAHKLFFNSLTLACLDVMNIFIFRLFTLYFSIVMGKNDRHNVRGAADVSEEERKKYLHRE